MEVWSGLQGIDSTWWWEVGLGPLLFSEVISESLVGLDHGTGFPSTMKWDFLPTKPLFWFFMVFQIAL